MCSTLARGVHIFQHQKSRSFSQHESVSSAVKWTAGAMRLVIVGRKGTQQAKRTEADGIYHRIESASQHLVGRTTPQHFERCSKRLPARGASCMDRAGVTTDPE